jgi:CDP-diacylglycerol--glycerol-3-phosphate 3-phosphatidyltransferase
MNLPNKITISRIILSIFTLILLIVPWYQLGINFKTFTIAGKIIVDSKYLLAGFLFIIASITDFLDGYIARSKNLVTDFGKVMDAIADKILVNGVLIILASKGFISVLVPVIIITRDTFVDSIKMASGNKGKVVGASILGKVKTICMMIGVSLMLFYNLPFELVGFPFADLLIIIACILSVISGCEYYYKAKDLIFSEK